MKHYRDEYEGQIEFYTRVGISPDLSHNTDGVDRGNLYENKLDIRNIYKVLSQAIKYASRIRIRGEKLPANIVLNDRTGFIAKCKIIDGIFKLLEDAVEFFTVTEHGAGIVAEYDDFGRVGTLIGKEQGKVCVNIIVLLRHAERTVFFSTEFHAVTLKGDFGGIESQILFKRAYFLKGIAIAVFYHLTNLFGRDGNAGRALTNIYAARLQSFSFEIVRFVTAFAHGNTDYLVFLHDKAHEHRDIRHDSVTDAIGNASVFVIYIGQTDGVSVIIYSDIHNASVRIGKGNDLFIDFFGKPRFEFNILGLKIHWNASLQLFLLYYIIYYTQKIRFFKKEKAESKPRFPLGINEFIVDDFRCLRSDSIHTPYPLHLVSGFECFRDAVTLGKLPY